MEFKDYGSAVSSLIAVLKEARQGVYAQYFSTPVYYQEEALAIHRAFEAWAVFNGIPFQDMAKLKLELVKYSQEYQRSTVLDILGKTLPDAFNVRGQWVPEGVVITCFEN